MRVFFSCSEDVCENIEKLLKPYGLKALFMRNLINALKDESGKIPEEHILAVLMNRFTISFERTAEPRKNREDELSELDRLSEMAKGFE